MKCLVQASRAALLVALAALAACGGNVVTTSGRAGVDAGAPDAKAGPTVTGTVTAPDCPGCSFPAMGAAPCASAPPVKIVYPPDGVLLPPNLGGLSVQWVPYGAPFTRFEVDFGQSRTAPGTDWRIITACSTSTTDSHGASTGGCELTVDPASWAQLAAANRGGSPIAVTVRGTTDGACASTSADTVHASLAQQDVPGSYFYWKSESTPLGTGGQIWRKTFGDPSTAEQNVTGGTFAGVLCAGCHAVARDGSRMVVYAIDDTDADYGGLAGSYLDATPLPAKPAVVVAGASSATTGTAAATAGQPPGWAAIAPGDAWYLSSNGLPCTGGATTCESTDGYPGTVSSGAFALWTGGSGAFAGALSVAAPGARPTMPDWSTDGRTLVYVVPGAVGSWDSGKRSDDDHVFGGSLYTVAFSGAGSSVPASPLVASNGENNYYPSYSPDPTSSYVLFDRVPLDTSVPTVTGCKGAAPQAVCPNDSFSNPAARLTLVPRAPGSPPVDLERANGSSSSLRLPLSNSYPRWVPAVQSYGGRTLYWITFSSTRDYGLRVKNQTADQYPCYPPDSLEWPGSTHHATMSAQCQEPQIWMAPVLVDSGGAVSADPSGVAFWVPYQDPTTHNHMAAWTK